ncbi:MAG: class I SAM-dependent methyltransferase [Candidatus Eisenbacteria bacterium]
MRGLVVQPAPGEFGRLYAREYFAGGDVRCGHVGDYFAERPSLLADGDHLAAWFESLHDGKPGRLLEVGCASGAVLEAAAGRGWTVQGVEYSADAASDARSHGVPVFLGGLEEAALPDAAYDIVFLGDVLEHVPDPAATLREVGRVLAPGGALALRGPMATHSFARQMGLSLMGALGRRLLLHEPPYHLWEFEPKTLAALSRAAGLEVESLRQAKTPPSLGKRRGAQALVVAGLDALNAGWTALTGTRGDRCTLVARKPRLPQPESKA